MKSMRGSFGSIVLQLALGLFLIVAGIVTVQLDGTFLSQLKAAFGGNEIASAVYSLFGRGDFSGIIIVFIGILEIAGGAFLLINFFVPTGSITDIILIAIMVMWAVVIVLVDIMGTNGLAKGALKNTTAFLVFLKSFSFHLLVLGAILTVKDK